MRDFLSMKLLIKHKLRGRLFPFTCRANMDFVVSSKLEKDAFIAVTSFYSKYLNTNLLTRSDNVLHINVGGINSIVASIKKLLSINFYLNNNYLLEKNPQNQNITLSKYTRLKRNAFYKHIFKTKSSTS